MIPFKIIPDGGEPYDLVATTRDIAKWEKTTKGATFSALESDKKVTDLYKIAFYAAIRQGTFDGSLADWESSVDLDFEDEDEVDTDPTQSAV